MKISAVVCTYKRYDLVRNCLKHLSQLLPSSESLEILVVENTPEPMRKSLAWVSNFAHARVVIEDTPGLSAARNTGINSSTGDIIAFLDDDAEVFPDWLQKIGIAFKEHPSALVIGGKVIPKFPDAAKPQWLSRKCEEFLSCIDWGDETRQVNISSQWLVGANIAYRRETFETYGNFGTNLGRKGDSSLLSNEESEFNGRLPSASVFYCGQAKVHHIIPSDRLTRDWFRKRAFWQAISDAISGSITEVRSKQLFDEHVTGVLRTPAEYRGPESMYYDCDDSAEFEHQLLQLYRIAAATATGVTSWPRDA